MYTMNIANVTVHIRKVVTFCLLVVVVCILSLSLAGCGGKKASPSPGSSGFGNVIETTKAELNAAEGQSLSLPDGTLLEIPAGSLAVGTELVLVHSEVPDGLEEYGLITDIYGAASVERTLATGDYTLAIPYDASLLPEDISEQDLQAFAVLDGPLVFPVPSHVDTERQMLIVENPNITVLEPSDGLTGLPFNLVLAGDQAELSPPPQTWRLETLKRNWKYAGGVKSNAELTCVEGAAGEVIEEEGHIFRIVLETPTRCEVVKEISSLLMEAFEDLNSAYGSPSDRSSSERMFVIIGDFVPGGQYLLNGSVGYFEFDLKWYKQATPEERREVIFHEMFHYIQDAHKTHIIGDIIHDTAEWFRGDAKWWYEATAQWVGLEAAAKWMARPDAQGVTTYEQVWDDLVKDTLATFPELLSVPVQESGDYKLGTYNKLGEYFYGYALLIKHVEEVQPGYLKEAVNGYDMSGRALYNTMVEEGRLDSTYPDFVRNLMQVALPDPGFWIKSGIEETSRETVHYSRFFNAEESGEEPPKLYRDDKGRVGPHRLFADSLGPLTTQFFRLQFQGVAEEPRCVNVQLSQGSQPSDQAWLVPVKGEKAETPVRLSASGTKMGSMGKDYDELWIAVFNPDLKIAKHFELNVELLDDGQCQEGLWKLDKTVVTPGIGSFECAPDDPSSSSSATLTDSSITYTYSDYWWTPQYEKKEYTVTYTFTVDPLPRSLAPGDVVTITVRGKGSVTGESPPGHKSGSSVDIRPLTLGGGDTWETWFQWVEGDDGTNRSNFTLSVEGPGTAFDDHVVKLKAPDIFDGELAIVVESYICTGLNIKWVYKAEKE